MVYICGCIPARIQHALANLPTTLDGTYERTLHEINEVDWKLAHRLFQFVAVTSRPLRIDEFAELLAFDFEAGPIPIFHEGWRSEDPVGKALSTCSSLLTIVDGGYPFGKIIQFSHSSVIEFLTSSRLAEASDVILRRYHISMIPAHTLAAQACLGILLHLDKNITSDNLEKLPFAEYAAEHWNDHARVDGVSQIVEVGLKQLFDPRKPYLAICVWICDPWERYRRTVRPLPPCGTALHYAALWGLDFIVKSLIIGRSQNVQSRAFSNNVAPLHLASQLGHLKAARMLIECGAHVMAQNNDGDTPLHLASQGGQLEVAHMLIERGAYVMAPNMDGETPLHLALQRGQVEVARMLVMRGARVTRNKDGETPLHLALQSGQVEVARMLIEFGAHLIVQNEDGETPLHLALQRGQVEVARMLVMRGADVIGQDKDGWNPFHLALIGGHVEHVRIFIQHSGGGTALGKHRSSSQSSVSSHRESFREYTDVARILFNYGADVTAQGRCRLSPLHLAAGGHVKLALILLNHSADATTQDWLRWSPSHLALSEEHVELTRILLANGEDPDVRDSDYCTPLHWASQQGHLEVVRVLIEHGIDINARDYSNWTPLHGASHYGHLEVVRFLLEHGADVHASDHGGWTSLQCPSYNGDSEIVRVLLEHGADANTRDNNNWTPLHSASQQGHWEVAEVLLEHGADANSPHDISQTPLDFDSRARYIRLLAENNKGQAVIMSRGRDDELLLTLLLLVPATLFFSLDKALSGFLFLVTSPISSFTFLITSAISSFTFLGFYNSLCGAVTVLVELLVWLFFVPFVFLVWFLEI